MYDASLSMSDLTSERVRLGRSRAAEVERTIGFRPRTVAFPEAEDAILDPREGHCLVIAPTGAGKGRNVIIHNALTYTGSMIVFDPKGEAATITSCRRERLNQAVYRLEPFAEGGSPDGLNPLHLLDPAARDYRSALRTVMRSITGGITTHADRFWDQTAEDLGVGVIAYFVEYRPSEERSLSRIRAFLCDPDLSYKIAVALDTELAGKTGPAVEEFTNFLGHEGEKVRTSVRSTLVQHLSIFAEPELDAALGRTSFRPADIVDGKPMTIFLIVPPSRLEAYAPLVRLWVAMLMSLITTRKTPPAVPTLFVLDELAQLGAFPLLRPAVTLMRSYGLKTMLILQDLSQLRAMFPTDAATIVNNCATVLTFGHTGLSMSKEMSELLGDITPEALFDMPRDMLAIRQHGQRTRIAHRIDYLTDPELAALARAHPSGPA